MARLTKSSRFRTNTRPIAEDKPGVSWIRSGGAPSVYRIRIDSRDHKYNLELSPEEAAKVVIEFGRMLDTYDGGVPNNVT